MSKVLILGSTGMLGLAVSEAFRDFNGDVFATARPGSQRSHSLRIFEFDAERFSLESLPVEWAEGDYLINCIGIIKSEIDENSPESVKRAKRINTDFSVELAKFAEQKGLRVIQIATDCVFSGHDGAYVESSPHDPTDVYGKTKSAGESDSKSVQHLRVSIIGPENRGFTSLYEWVNRQPQNAEITGFVNHKWNGIPAKHFGRIARAIIENNLWVAGVQHILPKDSVTKAELVRLIADHLGRRDIKVELGNGPDSIDRTLSSEHKQYNRLVWFHAGYPDVPTIAQLVGQI